MPDGSQSIHLDEIEPIPVVDGALDYDAYLAELRDALERRPDNPGALYHVACAEALAGRPDDALGHLRQALELRPDLAEHARADEDFVALRERPDWPL